jgi:hypothetical protein
MAVETAVTTARTARLAMTELAVELEALRGSSTNSSVSANGGTDNELKLAREAAREQAV